MAGNTLLLGMGYLYPTFHPSEDPKWFASFSRPTFYSHNNLVREVRLKEYDQHKFTWGMSEYLNLGLQDASLDTLNCYTALDGEKVFAM